MMLVFLVAFLVIVLHFIVIITSRTVYCFIYQNKNWNLWKKYIKLIDEFEYESESKGFVIPNTNVRAYIWEDGLCSIHWEDGCLSSFDTYHSKKMAKLLRTKIK